MTCIDRDTDSKICDAGSVTETQAHTELAELHLSNWRQFAEIDLDFHSSLTVLTGANAAGKTTLLGILAQHFNWATQLLGVPTRERSAGTTVWKTDNRESDLGARIIGTLVYEVQGQRLEALRI